VTPWPYPKAKETKEWPAPGAGHWHTTGWFGAAFTATELLEAPPPAQGARSRAFLSAAREACAAILSGSS
jgi:hypothetical protein